MSPFKKSLIVLLVLIIGAAVAIGLYFITPKATPKPPQTEVSLTDTPDYNACKVIDTNAIKTAEHGDAFTISDGLRAGKKAPNDTVADSCGFTLATKKVPNNTLNVEVYQYTATVNGNDKETADASWAQVMDIKQTAYFGKDLDGNTIIYRLRVIPGGKNVMFELRQPSETVTLDQPSALEFLTDLANKANYDVINPQTN